jgi:hypothetical protein
VGESTKILATAAGGVAVYRPRRASASGLDPEAVHVDTTTSQFEQSSCATGSD